MTYKDIFWSYYTIYTSVSCSMHRPRILAPSMEFTETRPKQNLNKTH